MHQSTNSLASENLSMNHFETISIDTGRRKEIMPNVCGCSGGAIRSIVLFLTKLHKKRLNLESETLFLPVGQMLADLWHKKDKMSAC